MWDKGSCKHVCCSISRFHTVHTTRQESKCAGDLMCWNMMMRRSSKIEEREPIDIVFLFCCVDNEVDDVDDDDEKINGKRK